MTRKNRSYILLSLLAVVALAVSLVTVARLLPASSTAAAPAAPVGMKLGERYHAVHVDGLKLKCDTCHVRAVDEYYDPMAQVFNLVDKRACLSCHSEGSSQPFYGEDWRKAKVSR